MKMFLAQVKVELIRTTRSKVFLFFTLLFPSVFYIIMTNALNEQKFNGLTFAEYYLVSMAVFGILSLSLNSLTSQIAFERKTRWIHFLQLTPLPSSIYLLSKLTVQSILSLLLFLVLSIIAYFTHGVLFTYFEYVLLGVTILIGSLSFQGLGLFLGLILKADYAQTVSSLIFITCSVLGGVFQPLELLPTFFQNVAVWLPTYQSAQTSRELIAGSDVYLLRYASLLAYTVLFFALSTWLFSRRMK
ncbi:ABC transporter permease [Priestia flexa]|uniref:ABC transporter permease n=1 Tax=Priestia flexa TaxID=86664 RepID=UPI001B3446A0|nr:ABC transporter permease [Priestia flexa]